MTFDLDIGHATRTGRRATNEDFVGSALPKPNEEARGLVAVIADGVSSGGGGREAAQTSVLSVVSDFHAAPETWDTTVVLDRLIGAQNAWLADHNRRRQGALRRGTAESSIGMTTLTALVLRGHAWTLAHVGDTRAWLVRGDQCAQLTSDHAFEEAFQRSRLTRAMGLDDSVRIDFERGELRTGDVFVLTTDGVHGVLGRAQIVKLLEGVDAQAASIAIVEAALKAGTRDNATAMVIRVRQLDAGTFEDTLLPNKELAVPRRLVVGDKLDGYTVVAFMVDTGVHLLYKARAEATGALVVIKTLDAARGDDAQERAMLMHEAWLATRVAEPVPPRGEAAFVRTHAGADASTFYTVFDWHAGQTLSHLQRQLRETGRHADVADVVAGGLAMARALARLHRHGVVHRDIKPDNLLLGDDSRWYILDLGAAVSGSDPVAMRGLHAGTPSYMNPEQWGLGDAEPAPADAASDVFALGATLYEWLTGKLPYGDVEPYQVGRFRRDPKPPSRLRPDIPIWLDDVLLKAVALEQARRFETAEELVVALERASARQQALPHHATPLITRDRGALVKIALATSLLFNGLLVYWILFLPR
jgi:serine/threonine protein phosphatase PrpC